SVSPCLRVKLPSADPRRGGFRLRVSGGRIIHHGPAKTGIWRPMLSLSACVNLRTQTPCNYLQENVRVDGLCRVASWQLGNDNNAADTAGQSQQWRPTVLFAEKFFVGMGE